MSDQIEKMVEEIRKGWCKSCESATVASSLESAKISRGDVERQALCLLAEQATVCGISLRRAWGRERG